MEYKIIREALTITKDKKIEILKFLKTTDVKLIENADGTRCNIDKLTDDQMKKLSELMFSDTIPEKFKI